MRRMPPDLGGEDPTQHTRAPKNINPATVISAHMCFGNDLTRPKLVLLCCCFLVFDPLWLTKEMPVALQRACLFVFSLLVLSVALHGRAGKEKTKKHTCRRSLVPCRFDFSGFQLDPTLLEGRLTVGII